MVKQLPITFRGGQALTPEEKETADKLSRRYYGKIERALQNTVDLVVHIKTYHDSEKKDQSKKFVVHVHVGAPTKTIRGAKAHDWDFATSLHKAFRDVESQIRHAFKS